MIPKLFPFSIMKFGPRRIRRHGKLIGIFHQNSELEKRLRRYTNADKKQQILLFSYRLTEISIGQASRASRVNTKIKKSSHQCIIQICFSSLYKLGHSQTIKPVSPLAFCSLATKEENCQQNAHSQFWLPNVKIFLMMVVSGPACQP